MTTKIRRIAALTVGQGLLAGFVLWAAQQGQATAHKRTFFSGLFSGSYYAECIDAVCDAEELDELYTQYKTEVMESPTASGSQAALARIAGRAGYQDYVLESFLSVGDTVRSQDFVKFSEVQARNPASAWTFNGNGAPYTGNIIQISIPTAMQSWSMTTPGATSFKLGRSVSAEYWFAPGGASNFALRDAAPMQQIWTLQIDRNVNVQPIFENQVADGGSATKQIGWSADVLLGSATVETLQEQVQGRCSIALHCPERPGKTCPYSPLFYMRPLFQENQPCLAAVNTCAPWSSIRQAEIMVNANYFQTCTDFYCASCAGIGGVSLSPHNPGEYNPDKRDPDTNAALDALLIYNNPLIVNADQVFAQIVPNASIASTLPETTSSAVAGNILVSNWQIDPCDNCHEGTMREPRTAVGIRPILAGSGAPDACKVLSGEQHLVIVVVQPGYGQPGATASGIANFMLNLCASDVLMLDGGGSSQFANFQPWNPFQFNPGTRAPSTLSPAGDRQDNNAQQPGYRPIPNALVVNPYPTPDLSKLRKTK